MISRHGLGPCGRRNLNFQKRDFSFHVQRHGGNCFTSNELQSTAAGYLLNAGGADVNIADSRGTPSTPVVCSSASQAALEKSVARCSTEDSAIADAVAAAA